MEEFKLNALENKLVEEMLAHARRSIEDGEYCDYDYDVVDEFIFKAEQLSKEEPILTINQEEVIKVMDARVRVLYMAAVESNLNSMLFRLKDMAMNINNDWEDLLLKTRLISQQEAAKKNYQALESKFLKSLTPAQKKMHKELGKTSKSSP